jgi:hypothetical protein
MSNKMPAQDSDLWTAVVLAFLALIFMTGAAGKFYRPIWVIDR